MPDTIMPQIICVDLPSTFRRTTYMPSPRHLSHAYSKTYVLIITCGGQHDKTRIVQELIRTFMLPARRPGQTRHARVQRRVVERVRRVA